MNGHRSILKAAKEATNIAADAKLDLRFIAWVKAGSVTLKRGANVMRFRMTEKTAITED